jgi:release factor glutamine methyltransferase
MTIAAAYQQTIDQLLPVFGQGEAVSLTRILFEDYFSIFDAKDNKNFTKDQQTDLQALTQKILEGQPVQYLVGKACFYGYFFKVTSAVLIPRPETEELVYLILQHFPTKELQTGLDIGTGSGCIPVALKAQRPNWALHASDISEAALHIARQNAEENKTQITFHQFDILHEREWPALPLFDFIVSNPPYIPPSEKHLMPEAVWQHEPALALFAPEEAPLLFYQKIVDFASRQLRSDGYLFFEVNEFNGTQVVQLMKENGFVDVLLEEDMQGKGRMVFGRKKGLE